VYTREDEIFFREGLMKFHPWRKGPFEIFGTYIDSEWRSDMKWERVIPHLESLEGKIILDAGCGNGYYCWRMAGAGASFVMGIDPMHLYVFQYFVLQNFIRSERVFVLPLSIEEFPPEIHCFDIVFSMGVIYHQKNPVEHLKRLKSFLKPGGTLVLETLVIQSEYEDILRPVGRYAKMKNVYFIPSVKKMESLLSHIGFREIANVDVTVTTVKEQRSTEWMKFESLSDFLNPRNPLETIEGYPAPVRALFTAKS